MLQEAEKYDIYIKLKHNIDSNPENDYDLVCIKIVEFKNIFLPRKSKI